MRTQSFQLNYAKVAGHRQRPDRPEHRHGRIVGQRVADPVAARRVVFETRTNQLFVTDIPSKLEEVQALIAKIDIPVRQVLIESRIVIADDSFGRSLGVRLGAVDLRGIRGGIPGYNVGGSNYVSPGGN